MFNLVFCKSPYYSGDNFFNGCTEQAQSVSTLQEALEAVKKHYGKPFIIREYDDIIEYRTYSNYSVGGIIAYIEK